MNIQTRILIGHGYLITLLVLAAGGAAVGFHDFGRTVGDVLNENFRSVRHAMGMLQALSEHEAAVPAALLGDATSPAVIRESERAFEEELSRAQSNVTIPGEEKLLEAVGTDFARYCAARDALFAAPPDLPLQAYARQARPHVGAVKAGLLRLLDTNHVAMIAADEDLRGRASRRATLLGLLVTLALLSLAFLSRELRRVVLRRLHDLRAVAQAIANGERTRRAATTPHDELGVVGAQLNRALDAQQQIEREMRGRLVQHRRLVLALLAARDRPVALISPAGAVIASTLSPEETRVAERAAAASTRSGDPGTEESTRSEDEWEVTLTPLSAPGRKPSGHLVSLARRGAGGSGGRGGRPPR